MKTFICPTCKSEWPENYCPECAHAIDSLLVQRAPPTGATQVENPTVSSLSTSHRNAPPEQAPPQRVRLGPIIRDVLIIMALLFIGPWAVDMTWHANMLAMVAAGLLLGTVGFIIAGCLAVGNRWRHLFYVAIGVWLMSILNVLFGPFGIFQWLLSIITDALMMGVGGSLSFLFKRDGTTRPKTGVEAPTTVRQGFNPAIFVLACIIIGILTAFFSFPDGKAEHLGLTLEGCFIGAIAGSIVGRIFAWASQFVYNKFGAKGRTLFLSVAMIAIIGFAIWVRASLQ
jgi:hypothetical protein